MTARKFLTRAQALARMRRGDLPTQGGGYSSALYFADGARTSGATGHKMHKDGLIERPAHSSVSSPYTLAQEPARRCVHCGEPEDGGVLGWFDAPDGLVCNACGGQPTTPIPPRGRARRGVCRECGCHIETAGHAAGCSYWNLASDRTRPT